MVTSELELPFLEPNAISLGAFENYTYARGLDGSASLHLYGATGSVVPVNGAGPHLAAVVDLVLAQRDVFAFGCYRVGELVGIWAQAPLRAATAANGRPIELVAFRRLSTGEHALSLSYAPSEFHGGVGVPWELVLQMLQAACLSVQPTVRVLAHEGEGRLVVGSTAFVLPQ